MFLNRRFGSGLGSGFGSGGSRAGESNIINADAVLTLASAGVLRVFPNKVVHAILGSGECVTLPIGLGNAGLAEFNLPVDIEVEEIAICLAAADIVECHRIAALHRYGQHELGLAVNNALVAGTCENPCSVVNSSEGILGGSAEPEISAFNVECCCK